VNEITSKAIVEYLEHQDAYAWAPTRKYMFQLLQAKTMLHPNTILWNESTKSNCFGIVCNVSIFHHSQWNHIANDQNVTNVHVEYNAPSDDMFSASSVSRKTNIIEMIHGLVHLQTLEFYYAFDQPIENLCLPSSIRELKFGLCFNQHVEGLHLPSSLLTLEFGLFFNQLLDKLKLPQSLQRLILGDSFQHSIQNMIFSPTFESLVLGSRVTYPLSMNIPRNITLSCNL
jgi:hypothetical protein